MTKSGAVLSRKQVAQIRASLGLVTPQRKAKTSTSTPPFDYRAALLRNPSMAAGSSSRRSYALTAGPKLAALRNDPGHKYLAMIMDPSCKECMMGYPDELIAPTALVHFQARATFTDGNGAQISNGTPIAGSVFTLLRSKVISLVTAQASGMGSGLIANGMATFSPPTTCDSDTSGSPYIANLSGFPSDYGGPGLSWANLTTIDRTLAASIRTRLIGLPSAQFMPPGVLYALTLQDTELVVTGTQVPSGLQAYLNSETLCIQAVTAGKGWSMTLNELNKLPAGAIHTLLPEGPNSFVLSQSDSQGTQPSGKVSYALLPPASDSPTVATGSSGGVVSNGPTLLVVVFGMTGGNALVTPNVLGTSLEFMYDHVVEYIPSPGAAGLLSTVSVPPSVQARQQISAGIHTVVARREGQTSVTALAPYVGQSGASTAYEVARSLIRTAPVPMGVRAGAFAVSEANRSLGGPDWVGQAAGLLL